MVTALNNLQISIKHDAAGAAQGTSETMLVSMVSSGLHSAPPCPLQVFLQASQDRRLYSGISECKDFGRADFSVPWEFIQCRTNRLYIAFFL